MADPAPDGTPDDAEHDPELQESAAVEPESTAEAETPPDESEAQPDEDAQPESQARPPSGKRPSPERVAIIIGLVLVVALGGLVGWLGYRTWQEQQDAELRELFLEAGRNGATALTTVDWEQADADVQRILESATGSFYDDMQRRAEPYTEVVKQAQSKSVGTVTEAGLTSWSDEAADVLVAVIVESSNAGAPEQAPRAWRMRLGLVKVGDEAKVDTVEFVT